MLKWITITLAALGLIVAGYAVSVESRKPPEPPKPAAPPSVNPFERGIAATGTVEARSRNRNLAAPEPALITEVLVEVGQVVTPGRELLKLDDRLLRTDLHRTEAQRDLAAARLKRLMSAPRAEEVAPLQAAVELAKVNLADAKDRLAELKRAGQNAVPTSDITRQAFAVEAAQAGLDRATTQLQLVTAGTWDQDIAVSRAELAAAERDVQALLDRIDRLTVRAPAPGTILRRNAEPGQYASVTSTLLVLGDLTALRVRARVDEEDSPQLRDGAEAVARVRGIMAETIPLAFIRVEPLASPKADLTGASTERVDTRVVDVLFELKPGYSSRIFPGQVVDVFIQVKP